MHHHWPALSLFVTALKAMCDSVDFSLSTKLICTTILKTKIETEDELAKKLALISYVYL